MLLAVDVNSCCGNVTSAQFLLRLGLTVDGWHAIVRIRCFDLLLNGTFKINVDARGRGE